MKYLILGTLGLFGVLMFSIIFSSILTQDFSLLKIMNINHYLTLLIVCLGLGGIPLQKITSDLNWKMEDKIKEKDWRYPYSGWFGIYFFLAIFIGIGLTFIWDNSFLIAIPLIVWGYFWQKAFISVSNEIERKKENKND